MSDSEAVTADAVDGSAIDMTPELEDALEDITPSGSDLVVRDASDRTEVSVVLDKHDEAMILEEMQRRLTAELLYDFPQDGSRVVDLSYVGVRECVLLMNQSGKCRIRIVPDSARFENAIEDVGNGPEDCLIVTLMAENELTGMSVYGTFVQPKRIHLKPDKAKKRRAQKRHIYDDDTIANPHARTVALGKAQRNAWKLFIPERLRQTLIAQYKGDSKALKVIQAGAGAEAMAELPPPLRDERADELRARAREVYLEIRAIDPTIITPAALDNAMRRAESAHDRLEDLIGYLEATRDSNKGGKS